MQREIEPLEEFEAQPVIGYEMLYETRDLIVQDIVKKINEIIEYLNTK